jgi:hypothetical protein
MTTLRRAISVTALLAGFAPAPLLGQLDPDQQACLNAMNKDAAKLAAAQGKVNGACLKDAGKGKLPAGQSADQCLLADAKGKVAKASAKIGTDFTARCGTLPPFGLPVGSVSAQITDLTLDQSFNLLADVFGASLSTAAADCGAEPALCKCQRTVGKMYEKLAKAKFKEFVKCKKAALKAGAMVASALQACIDDAGTPGSIAADSKGKIGKARNKLGDAIGKKCGSGVSTALGFPGLCASLSGNALRDCSEVRVECRVCLTLNAIDNLSVNCDSFDDGQINLSCPYETFNLRSAAQPAQNPGSPGVVVTNPLLITQFGSADVSLNNARFTRFRLDPTAVKPDAIMILIPGFEGGANDFKILAENLIPRVFASEGLVLEVWAYDRRSNQLEDLAGLEIAEAQADPQIALDWLFGGELMLTLDPALVAGPNRRAVFYNGQADTAFIANWTPLVFTRDIDAIVEKARSVAANGNVFLGGHSAGTGFTARYAATDFNFSGTGPAQPGYAKLRGLALFEGGGGSTGGAPLTADTLDRIEAKFDGGLYGAVRDNANRCVDGTTVCTLANEATACAGQTPPKCTLATSAYTTGLLNPRLLAASEVSAIQAINDPDTGPNLLIVDQGAPGNNAVDKVANLGSLNVFPPATAQGGIGMFVDDDGFVAILAPFVAVSAGTAGAVIAGLTTWHDITEGPMPPDAVLYNGMAPTALPGNVWGQEKEVTRIDRMTTTFYAGHTNFTDWYYPSSGLSVTSVGGVVRGNLHRRQRRRLRQQRAVQPIDQPRLDRPVDRTRSHRHREPHSGRGHRHSRHRFRRHQRPGAGARALHPVRAEHRTVHGAELQRDAARRRRHAAESSLPDLRRPRRRLRGAHDRRRRARRRADGGGQRRQQRAGAADGVHRAECAVKEGFEGPRVRVVSETLEPLDPRTLGPSSGTARPARPAAPRAISAITVGRLRPRRVA